MGSGGFGRSYLTSTIAGVSGYTSTTDADRAAMLEAIGVSSVEELFDGVPAGVRLDGPLELPDGLGEAEVADCFDAALSAASPLDLARVFSRKNAAGDRST